MTEERHERLRRRAEKILSDGAFTAAGLSSTSVQEIVHELYVHQAELEIQNEELRTAQQALEVSRLEYVQLFQSQPLACFTVNAAGIVGEANAAAERQFGLSHRQLKGRPLTLLVDAVDHGRLLAALVRLRETGIWVRQEFQYRTPNGLIDGLTDGRQVPLEDGDKGDLLLTVTDVTERNAWVREVQAARDAAERAQAAYHHILQAVADGIFGVDANGLVTFANAAAQAMTGHLAADLAGTPLVELFSGGGAEGPQAIVRSLADGQARQIGQQRLRRADGGVITIAFTVAPMTEFGRITGAVVAFRDVTAHLAAEAALRLSEQRHRTLVQSLHEGLVMRSADGTVLVSNAMADRLLAGPAAVLLDPRAAPLDDAPLDKAPLDKAPLDKAPRKRATAERRFIGADSFRLKGLPPAARAYRSGEPVIEQVVGITGPDGPGGPTRWLRVSSHPVHDGQGHVEAVVSSVTDITTIKAMERALNVALDAKERFMASASHDLRQPVQALMLFSNLLFREDLGEGARRLAEQLCESVGSLGTLLDGLLDISKLEAGLIKPAPSRVDLGALLDRLNAEFAPLAAAAGLRLTTVPARQSVQTDGTLLERVLRNLLANALRYTRQGRVLFGVRRRPGLVRIEVWDTGIGIAENQIDRIFQDFYQVGNAARDRREGLGMGLSIAKRLIVMLGGTLDVRSTLGKGSCFAVGLPTRAEDETAPAAPGGARGTDDAPADGTPTDGTPTDGIGALVLLVEDDAVIRRALAMMLEGWGYRVVDAGSVAEALEHVTAGVEPDVVLADYRLPGGETGLMLMDTVRRRRGRDTPGVLLTGDTSADRLREAAAAQCALLHKPIQPQLLQDAVRRSLASGG